MPAPAPSPANLDNDEFDNGARDTETAAPFFPVPSGPEQPEDIAPSDTPPEADTPDTDTPDDTDDTDDIAFDPATPRPQHNGWTAERQRGFIQVLAETGCVVASADAVGMNARSAYRLRLREDGVDFARAWDAALKLATTRLVAMAFDRAMNGIREETWKDGALASVKIRPAERTHLFLLRHLDPMRFGNLAGIQDYPIPNPVSSAAMTVQETLPKLRDISEDAQDARERSEAQDVFGAPTAPGDGTAGAKPDARSCAKSYGSTEGFTLHFADLAPDADAGSAPDHTGARA